MPDLLQPGELNPVEDLGDLAASAMATAMDWDDDSDIVPASEDEEDTGTYLDFYKNLRQKGNKSRDIRASTPVSESDPDLIPETESESESKSESESESESQSEPKPEDDGRDRVSRRVAFRLTPRNRTKRSSTSSSESLSPEGREHQNKSPETASAHPEAVEKERRKQKSHGAKVTGEPTICLLCNKSYSQAWNAQRHLRLKHHINKNDAEYRTSLKIGKDRTRPCKFCGKHIRKLNEHAQVCKERRRKDERVKRKGQREQKPENVDDSLGESFTENIMVDEDFVRLDQRTKFTWKRTQAGAALGPMLARHMSSKDMAMATRVLYLRKLKEILCFFEDTVPNFKANNLLKPVELHCRLPNLGSFLASKDSRSSRATACSAYLTLARAHYEYVEDLYGNSKELKEKELANMLLLIKQKIASATVNMKSAAVSAKKDTATKKFSKRQVDLDLKQDPEQMQQIIRDFGNSKRMKRLEKQLLEDYQAEVSRLEIGESTARHLILANLLAYGTGHRPSVFCRMTIKEFLDAKPNDGILEVVVADHKTKGVYECRVPIVRKPVETLMRLYLKHSRGYKHGKDASAPFFVSSKGTALERLSETTNWLKTMVLIPEFGYSEEQLRTLTPECFRHGWSNWGQASNSKTVRESGPKVMCHSKATQQRNYAAGSHSTAFTTAILRERFPEVLQEDQSSGDAAGEADPGEGTSWQARERPKRLAPDDSLSFQSEEEEEGDEDVEEGETDADSEEEVDGRKGKGVGSCVRARKSGGRTQSKGRGSPPAKRRMTCGESDEDEPVYRKSNSIFSPDERNTIRRALMPSGDCPRSVAASVISKAADLNPDFQTLLERMDGLMVKDKDGNDRPRYPRQSDRNKALLSVCRNLAGVKPKSSKKK